MIKTSKEQMLNLLKRAQGIQAENYGHLTIWVNMGDEYIHIVVFNGDMNVSYDLMEGNSIERNESILQSAIQYIKAIPE